MKDNDITPSEWRELSDLANRAGTYMYSTMSQARGRTTSEDIAQLCLMRFVESPRSARSLLDLEPHRRLALMKTYAAQAVGSELDDYFSFHGQYYYSTHEVRGLLEELLELYFSDNVELIADRVDLLAGLDGLTDSQTNLLRSRYVDDEKPPRGSSDERKTYLAVERLTDLMNRSYYERNDDWQKSHPVGYDPYKFDEDKINPQDARQSYHGEVDHWN